MTLNNEQLTQEVNIMKKTVKIRITAVAMTLVMVVALSATAFADGPQGAPRQGGMKMGQQQMNGFSQNAPMGGFDQNSQMDNNQNAPMGGFDQNSQMDNNQNAPMGGFDRDSQMGNHPMDPVNQILDAVSELEDEEVKSNLETLLQAHLEALEAERSAENDDDRAEAAEAVAAAQAALDTALEAAGISITAPEFDGQQPPEMPEGNEPPSDDQQPPEKPEDNGQIPQDAPQMNDQNHSRMQELFEQFLEWLKNKEESDAA